MGSKIFVSKIYKITKIIFCQIIHIICSAYFRLCVEIRMLRVDPPDFSSAGRSYKRSSSVGFSQFACGGTITAPAHYSKRAHSLKGKGGGGMGHRAAVHLHSSRPLLSTQMEEKTVASCGSAAESPRKTAVTELRNDHCEPDGTNQSSNISKNVPDEPMPTDAFECQSAPVKITHANSPKFHSSNRSNPLASSAMVMERQRTHMVMTVDQKPKPECRHQCLFRGNGRAAGTSYY
jgi:hypothetical protein